MRQITERKKKHECNEVERQNGREGMEGCSAWETFWKITLPMVSPMILVNTIYTIIDAFTSSDNQVMSYISKVYEEANGNVLSSAMSWMYFLIVILIIAAVAGVLSAFVFYQRRD